MPVKRHMTKGPTSIHKTWLKHKHLGAAARQHTEATRLVVLTAAALATNVLHTLTISKSLKNG